MLRSPARRVLLICATLFHCCLRPGEARPHVARDGAPNPGGPDGGQRTLLLEAVKTGILGSLGMDREPRLSTKASHQDLGLVYQLYREKVRALGGNSSQAIRGSSKSRERTSTILFPETVQPVKVHLPESGQQIQWYRAIFYKNQIVWSDWTLVGAELKISRPSLGEPRASRPGIRQEIHVKVMGMRPDNTTATLYLDTVTNSSVSGPFPLDVRPGVETWRRSDDVQSLVVELGLVGGQAGDPEANPTVGLQISREEPRPAGGKRRPRSAKEDACSEQGWCCRKEVTVSFKEIGWSDWVVAPTSYTMHFCDGSCPHNYKPAAMHTQVKSRLHQLTKGETPRPCCVPAAYEPLILMYYDSTGRLKVTPFTNLIVTKCYCA